MGLYSFIFPLIVGYVLGLSLTLFFCIFYELYFKCQIHMNSSLIEGYRISPLRNSPFSGELGVEKVIKKKAREVKYIGKFQE